MKMRQMKDTEEYFRNLNYSYNSYVSYMCFICNLKYPEKENYRLHAEDFKICPSCEKSVKFL